MNGLLLHPAVVTPDDIRITQSQGKGYLEDASTGEVLTMVLGHHGDDIIFGRSAQGVNDPSDFDYLPVHEWELNEDTARFAYSSEGDSASTAVNGEDDETPALFTPPPAEDPFPVFKAALSHFQAQETPPRVVRIDTPGTYGDFVCERAVREIDRRVRELRAALEEHLDEHTTQRHPGYRRRRAPLSRWDDVLGAAEAVANLHAANTPNEATDAMPQVPVDLPPFAEGKVKCWRDGASVVCSVRFVAVNGEGRIATMASRPKADADEVARWAMRAGIDPVVVLGVLPDLTAVACGKRLVRDVAGAALHAHRRTDVCGMDKEPVLLARPGNTGTAPLAALMFVEQRAAAGDPQAQAEMNVIRLAAQTPAGQQVAAPLLAESKRRLAAGIAQKRAGVWR